MSACLILQQKDSIYVGSDTAVSVDINNKIYRISNDGKKLYQIENKLIFCSGNLTLAYLIMNTFIKSKNYCSENMQKIAVDLYNKSNDVNKEIEILVCSVEDKYSKVSQISSYENFQIIDHVIDDDNTYLWTAGIKTEECLESAYKNIRTSKSIQQMYKNAFNDIAFEGVGGTLEVYQLTHKNNKLFYTDVISDENISYYQKNYCQQHLILAQKIVGKLLVGEKLVINNEDGTVQITGDGVMVKTPQGAVKVKLGKLDNGKYGISIYSSTGQVMIDESGMLQADSTGARDNVDNTHPLRIKFFIPNEVLSIKSISLNFSIQKFRTYETLAGQSATTTTANGGGFDFSGVSQKWGSPKYVENYTNVLYPVENTQVGNGVYVYFADFEHVHEIKQDPHTHNFPHVHNLTYAIYEGSKASNIKITINGTLRDSTGYNADTNIVDITQWIQTGWNEILLSSDTLGRLEADVSMLYFLGI